MQFAWKASKWGIGTCKCKQDRFSNNGNQSTIQSRLNKNQVLKASETKKTGVRWKDDVDTYIIQADSNSEHKKPRKKQKKKKRKSPRILVDLENAKQLEDYLRQLDEEARPTTDRDFWDTLEDSIDGLLSVFSGDSSQGSVPTAKKPWYYKFWNEVRAS